MLNHQSNALKWVIIFKLLVKKYRLRKNLTQKQLAELAMLSESYISLIERGSKIPSLSTLEKISKALKVNMGNLIKDDIDYTKTKNRKKHS